METVTHNYESATKNSYLTKRGVDLLVTNNAGMFLFGVFRQLCKKFVGRAAKKAIVLDLWRFYCRVDTCAAIKEIRN